MPLYETTILFDSFLKDDDFQSHSTKIQNFIKNNGGQIQKVEEWGKKRLAYEISRKQYGNYLHITFHGPSSLPNLLEREYRLEETILRFLTIKADPKMVTPSEKKVKAKKTAETQHAQAVDIAEDAMSASEGYEEIKD